MVDSEVIRKAKAEAWDEARTAMIFGVAVDNPYDKEPTEYPDIKAGDIVDISLMVQVETVEIHEKVEPNALSDSPYIRVTYLGGSHQIQEPDTDFVVTKSDLFTVEVPLTPPDGLRASINKTDLTPNVVAE